MSDEPTVYSENYITEDEEVDKKQKKHKKEKKTSSSRLKEDKKDKEEKRDKEEKKEKKDKKDKKHHKHRKSDERPLTDDELKPRTSLDLPKQHKRRNTTTDSPKSKHASSEELETPKIEITLSSDSITEVPDDESEEDVSKPPASPVVTKSALNVGEIPLDSYDQDHELVSSNPSSSIWRQSLTLSPRTSLDSSRLVDVIQDHNMSNTGFNNFRRERRASSISSFGSNDHSRPSSTSSQRDLVAMEIFSTEESYNQNLEHIITVYLEKSKDIFTENEHRTIFSNIVSLKSFSQKLLEDLQYKIANWTLDSTLGDVFSKYVPFFKMYTLYCNNYETANECVKTAMKRKEVHDFIEREKKNSFGLDFDSLLVSPVQRVPRIKLLIKELLKFTPENHADKKTLTDAYNKISDIANLVNETMKNNQGTKVYEGLLESVKGIASYLEVHRKFIMEGQFGLAMFGSDRDKEKSVKFSSHWLLLFSDMIIFATGEKKQKRKMVGSTTLNSIWIKNATDKFENCLEIVTPEDIVYFVKISSAEERKNWFDTITDKIKGSLRVVKGNEKASDANHRFLSYRFSHGGIYEGEFSDAKMNGKGIFIFPNGSSYEGDWKDGQMHGRGKYVYGSGEIYEGEYKNNLQNGGGVFKAHFCKYSGNFLEGKMEGYGDIEWVNGDKYSGGFKADLMDGTGTLTCVNGSKYIGDWRNNMMHGNGKLKYPDGSDYEGQFQFDKRHGVGKMVYPNGDSYNGNWKNNKRNGVGTFIGNDGNVKYQTQWVDDLPEGTGQCIIKVKDEDYLKYDGDWKSGKREGKGGLVMNGAKYSGSWVGGKREGFGAFQDCVGTYQGPWKGDKRNGNSLLTYTNESELDGDWKDDFVTKATLTFKNEQGKSATQEYNEGRVVFEGMQQPVGIADLPQAKWLL